VNVPRGKKLLTPTHTGVRVLDDRTRGDAKSDVDGGHTGMNTQSDVCALYMRAAAKFSSSGHVRGGPWFACVVH
jgi:hypothetical protein